MTPNNAFERTMSHLRDKSHRALKRLLANGPLTAVPKRPDDQALRGFWSIRVF